MNKIMHGGARAGAGRKGKYKEPTKPVRIPVSKLPAVFELLESVQNQDIIGEYSLIESYLYHMATEKKVYLCEWFEGANESGVKIPMGFMKYSGSLRDDFEEYKGENLDLDNVQNQKQPNQVDHLVDKIMTNMSGKSETFKKALAGEFLFRQTCKSLDLMSQNEQLMFATRIIERYQPGEQVQSETDSESFRRAYDKIGSGRHYVTIYDLRSALGWPVDRFDSVLVSLAKNGDIILQGGDPSTLTSDQISQSYMDGDYLRVAVSWSKDKL